MSEITFHLVQDFPNHLVLPPVPSKKLVPDWFKKIPGYNGKDQTVKKCVPFLDAMTMGYTILNHIDIVVYQRKSGEIRLDFLDKEHEIHIKRWPPIESHPSVQMPGAPFESYTILKWMSPWIVETSPDYSLLFLPPINRLENPIVPLTGLVDTDSYFNQVNIPFIHTELTPGGKKLMIPAGTPICQIIPIKRTQWKAKYKFLEEDSIKRQMKAREDVQKDREDWYKNYAHQKKKYD